MTEAFNSPSKTMLRRLEQYNDRWSSLGLNTGIISVSNKLSAAQLRRYELFENYPDKFLEKISPDVSVAVWKKDALLFEEGTYIDLAFFIVSGEVEMSLKGKSHTTRPSPIFETGKFSLPDLSSGPIGEQTVILDMVALSKQTSGRKDNKEITFLSTMDFNLPRDTGVKVGAGEFFGEIGALSGWPQSVTAKTLSECTLIQIRLPALRSMKIKTRDLKDRLDQLYRERSLFSQLKSTPIFKNCGDILLQDLTDHSELVSLNPGETLVRQGDPADAFYLVRSGFLKLIQGYGKGEMIVSYLSKGMTFGEGELLMDVSKAYDTTAVSVEYAELIKIPRSNFRDVIETDPATEEHLWENAGRRIKEVGYSKRHPRHSEFIQAALERGLVQGNSILAIDLDTCTRCDDCVRACAATHSDRPRFIREGSRIDHLLIPKSCFHCQDPVCLVGCPTGAIHRAGVGSVVEIDGEICIGCGTCSRNCPYDSIVMHDMNEKWPGDMVPTGLRGLNRLQASKCDLCEDTGHGPACVNNCPQGSAIRLDSLKDFKKLLPDSPEKPNKKQGSIGPGSFWWWSFAVMAGLCLVALLLNIIFGTVEPHTTWGMAYGAVATFLMIAVALFAGRRGFMRIATRLHLGSARSWLAFHLYGGALFLLLVLMHSGFRIPSGAMNRWLLGLSLWTVLTGVLGLILQKWIPRVLSSGLSLEILQQRIPELVDDLRKRAEELIASGDPLIRNFYRENLAPAMAGPDRRLIFFIDITGGIQKRLSGFAYLRHFLGEEDIGRLNQLEQLFKTKLEVDAHYTLQRPLRWWLYAHVPTSILLIVLVAFHLFAVFYY